MNREDIIRMAQEARQGVDIYYNTDEQLEGFFERFANLVASAERERILEICKEGLWDAEGIRYHLDTQARGHVATNDTSQERVDKTSEIVHEPWSPVSIGVDITKEGAHVVGIYALDNDTSQVFYAKYYPIPQRKPLTENEIKHLWYEACQTNLELTSQLIVHLARNIEAAHGIKGEA